LKLRFSKSTNRAVIHSIIKSSNQLDQLTHLRRYNSPTLANNVAGTLGFLKNETTNSECKLQNADIAACARLCSGTGCIFKELGAETDDVVELDFKVEEDESEDNDAVNDEGVT
jgi:hypothetical protein